MNNTNKLHRVMSIIAAIFMVFQLISGMITMATSVINMARYGEAAALLSSLAAQLTGIASTVIFMIVLFRGKKDLIAGVLLLLAGLSPLIRTGNFLLLLIDGSIAHYFRMYAVMNLLANLLSVAFCIALAVECMARGLLSAGFGRLVLVVLPLFATFFGAVAGVLSILYTSRGTDIAVILIPCLTTVLPILLGGIPELLTGIAFAIPVREQIPSAF